MFVKSIKMNDFFHSSKILKISKYIVIGDIVIITPMA